MRIPMTRIYMGVGLAGERLYGSAEGSGGNDSNGLVTPNRPRTCGRRGGVCRRRSDLADYFSRLITLNIGMYSAITAAPTAAPITAISRGSIREVMASTVAVTSLL
jgi:hypothetical protein